MGRIFRAEDFDDAKPQISAGVSSTPGRVAAGGMLNILNALTAGFGDELSAAGSAGLGSIKRLVTGAPGSFGEDYDQKLEVARDLRGEFRQQSPVGAIAQDIIGGGLLPLGQLSTAGGIFKNAARAGGRAAAVGGAYGFGEGEGGLSNRLENGKNSALISGLVGGALGGGAKAIEKGARSISTKAADAASETMEKGLGVQYGDRVKGLNRVNLFVDEAGEIVPYEQAGEAAAIQAPIQRQIETLKKAGIFENAPDDIGALKIYLTGKAKKIGEKIGDLSRKADEALGPVKILPNLEATNKFIDGYRGSVKNGLKEKVDDILADYAQEPGSGFTKLTKFLDKLQKETSFDNATPKEVTQLKRFISYDLRKTAEKVFDKALPDYSGTFAKNNELYAGIATIGKTLNKSLARKVPGFYDFITGGSLPMTVGAGIASAPLGLGPGALAAGTFIGARGAKKLVEAVRPMSTARTYESLGDAAGRLADNAEAALPIAQKLGVSTAPALAQKPQDAAQGGEQEAGGLQSASQQQQRIKNQVRPQTSAAAPKKRRVFREEDFDPIEQGAPSPAASQPGELKREVSAFVGKLSPLIQAVIATESSGNPNARSPKGARGLMQVMPEHYKRLGVTDPSDPVQNVKAGITILDEELERFDKDLYLALASYNAGPTRVINAIAKAGSKDFTRVYPFLPEETKKYVAKFVANFQRIKGGQNAA